MRAAGNGGDESKVMAGLFGNEDDARAGGWGRDRTKIGKGWAGQKLRFRAGGREGRGTTAG